MPEHYKVNKMPFSTTPSSPHQHTCPSGQTDDIQTNRRERQTDVHYIFENYFRGQITRKNLVRFEIKKSSKNQKNLEISGKKNQKIRKKIRNNLYKNSHTFAEIFSPRFFMINTGTQISDTIYRLSVLCILRNEVSRTKRKLL